MINCDSADNGIFCVFVTHNPSQNIGKIVKFTLGQVANIIIVDNDSDAEKKLILNKLAEEYPNRITIIFNHTNLQFAAAMNIGIKAAIDKSAKYILQLNDDNYLSDGAVDSMLQCFEMESQKTIGIVAPTVIIDKSQDFIPTSKLTDHQLIASAGMLISAETFKTIGYYDEDLVIGYDDYDLSLRAYYMGYRCVVTGSAALYANLGRMEKKRLVRKNILVFNYSPIRRFYAARNGIFLLKRWRKSKDLYEWVKWWEINSLIGVVFFEEDKLRKLALTLSGYVAGLRNKMGYKL